MVGHLVTEDDERLLVDPQYRLTPKGKRQVTNDKLRERLLPCPFCGNTDLNQKTHSQPWGEDGEELFQGFVECEHCGGRGPPSAWYSDHEGALYWLRKMLGTDDDNWNTRELDTATAAVAELDRLEAENARLRGQLVATLAGTYNVAPHATTTMCGRLDESGELLASVKQVAASLHSIKPDQALATYRESVK